MEKYLEDQELIHRSKIRILFYYIIQNYADLNSFFKNIMSHKLTFAVIENNFGRVSLFIFSLLFRRGTSGFYNEDSFL